MLPLWDEGAEGAGGRKSYPTNDIPNKHIYEAFLMIYLSILLLFTFCYFKGVNQRFTKAAILQFCNTLRESSR